MAESTEGFQKQRSLTFVVDTGKGTKDEQTRKLIRRKVMLGKNKAKRKTKLEALTSDEFPYESNPYAVASTELNISIPGRVGGDLSFIRFADSIEPQLLIEVIRCRFL